MDRDRNEDKPFCHDGLTEKVGERGSAIGSETDDAAFLGTR